MVIDEKGKLFGKINFFDFLVLLFILSTLSVSPIAWKILNKPQPQSQTSPQPQPKTQPKTTIEISISEYEGLKNKIRDYELLLDTISKQRDIAGKERDFLQNKIDNFLKEHRRAKKWFQ